MNTTPAGVRAAVLAALVAVTLVLGGCTSSQPQGQALPSKNLERWALPLDQYADQSSALLDYAENLMVARCLAKQGIDWPVPWRPLDAPPFSPSETALGARLFDQKVAAKYGYHAIPVVYQGKDEQRQAFNEINSMIQRDPVVDEKSTVCLNESRKTLPLPSSDAQNYVLGAAVGLHEASLRDPAVRAATGKWRTCIEGAGFGGLADSPEGMPGDAKSEEWKLGDPPSDPVATSPEELRTAVADAKCRASSGWSQALYDADYNAQVAFVKKNADKLNRIRDELAADKKRLLAAATKYAPK